MAATYASTCLADLRLRELQQVAGPAATHPTNLDMRGGSAPVELDLAGTSVKRGGARGDGADRTERHGHQSHRDREQGERHEGMTAILPRTESPAPTTHLPSLDA